MQVLCRLDYLNRFSNLEDTKRPEKHPIYMLNDLDKAAESDQGELLSGKLVVTISGEQYDSLESKELVLISIGESDL